MKLGSHTVKSWSKTQSLIALSSGESEFYAALKASAEGLGVMSMLKDFGVNVRGNVLGDASAALGIINRKGLGRTRHIDTGLLWIQQTAAEKRLSYQKVLGIDNPADLMTKYLNAETIDRHCSKLDISFPGGRAAAAPNLNAVFDTKAIWELGLGEEYEDQEEHEEEEMTKKIQEQVSAIWKHGWKVAVRRQVGRGLEGVTKPRCSDR